MSKGPISHCAIEASTGLSSPVERAFVAEFDRYMTHYGFIGEQVFVQGFSRAIEYRYEGRRDADLSYLLGVQFRHGALGNGSVDFIVGKRLNGKFSRFVVELDGDEHRTLQATIRDREKEWALITNLSLHTLRIQNETFMSNKFDYIDGIVSCLDMQTDFPAASVMPSRRYEESKVA